MGLTTAFLLGFCAVAGAATAMGAIGAIMWTASSVVQFAKRYEQAKNPKYGINKETVRERAYFALHAAIHWPRV